MKPVKPMKLVRSPDDIPVFATEAEEAAFWAEHAFDDAYPTTEADADPRLADAQLDARAATRAKARP